MSDQKENNMSQKGGEDDKSSNTGSTVTSEDAEKGNIICPNVNPDLLMFIINRCRKERG